MSDMGLPQLIAMQQLMTGQSFDAYPGIYDPQMDFQSRVQDAYRLGIKPPESPMNLQDYIGKLWPFLEQEVFNGPRKRIDQRAVGI